MLPRALAHLGGFIGRCGRGPIGPMLVPWHHLPALVLAVHVVATHLWAHLLRSHLLWVEAATWRHAGTHLLWPGACC